ncbi:hypothetical protein T484DRAFT_1740364 [Baffinella frigidus]|nr:hypothetical protein T484DRAFT_1740364 [Cryptophyta sp. CCMP2293]
MGNPAPSSHASQPNAVPSAATVFLSIDAELAFLSIARAERGRTLRRQDTSKPSSCLDLEGTDPTIFFPAFEREIEPEEWLAIRSVARQMQQASNLLRPPKICSTLEPSLEKNEGI